MAELLDEAVRAGVAVHLDGGRLATVGIDKTSPKLVDLGTRLRWAAKELRRHLIDHPDAPQAESARKLMFTRTSAHVALRMYKRGEPVTLAVTDEEKQLEDVWKRARKDPEAARRFPNALRALRKRWLELIKG